MSPPETCSSICSATTRTIRLDSLIRSFPDWPRRVTCALPDRLKPARQGNQMDTMTQIRPIVQRPRRVLLTAGPAAAGEARSHVRAAIHAWHVPIDLYVAVLLTSELVTEEREKENTQNTQILLIITWADGQMRVEV